MSYYLVPFCLAHECKYFHPVLGHSRAIKVVVKDWHWQVEKVVRICRVFRLVGESFATPSCSVVVVNDRVEQGYLRFVLWVWAPPSTRGRVPSPFFLLPSFAFQCSSAARLMAIVLLQYIEERCPTPPWFFPYICLLG
jgi:hypothetical protein